MSNLVRLVLLAVMAGPMPATAQEVIAGVGFENSEAARFDPADDRYIVSNLGPRGAQDDGFISLVSPEGEVLALKWIAGGINGVRLQEPLGLFIAGDEVHVADQKAIRVFDRQTGAPLRSIDIPDAVRLNDLFVTEAGVTYVTDSGTADDHGALYRIQPDGTVEVFAERSASLHRANGIAVNAAGQVVHGGLLSNVLTFRDAATGAILREQTLPTGRIDGIVPLANGGLLVASQDGHNVYHVPPEGEPREVAGGVPIPAAIGYDSSRRRLLVPQIVASSLTLFDIEVE
ncbi:SMP-30/gluconolactonase/LRE family protein [Croceibacterium sp. TMG7-5b_MA50]|uniref:SMP-30/gluconolactonase/LRE family protein n=1 Tax=Croceibacterium sp. TMG7-5b_MA50 TaxID=3121290 RepID=UPI003221EED5